MLSDRSEWILKFTYSKVIESSYTLVYIINQNETIESIFCQLSNWKLLTNFRTSAFGSLARTNKPCRNLSMDIYSTCKQMTRCIHANQLRTNITAKATIDCNEKSATTHTWHQHNVLVNRAQRQFSQRGMWGLK